MVQNTIYSLTSSDYGKDLNQMASYLDQTRDYLNSNGVADPVNPVRNNTIVKSFLAGSVYFLNDCKTCRAYCSLQKTFWSSNSTLRSMLSMDIVTDQIKTLVT